MAQLLPKLAASLNDIKLVGPALVMHMARILAEECYKEFKVLCLVVEGALLIFRIMVRHIVCVDECRHAACACTAKRA
jgi:hypothetical protein